MSCFLGAQSGLFGGMLIASDERNALPYHQWGRCIMRSINSFADGALWPNTRGLGGQVSDSLTGDAGSYSGMFILNPGFDDQGGAQMKKIIGNTLDADGLPLGNCVIQGFVSATDTYVGQVISDTNGYYELPTPHTGFHYIVAYKSGSPDVAGTSVNTLTPV